MALMSNVYPFLVQDPTTLKLGLAVKRGARADGVVAYMDHMAELRINDLLDWQVPDACYGTPAAFVARVLKQHKQGMKIPESAVARLSSYTAADLADRAHPNRAHVTFGEDEMAKAKAKTPAADKAAAPAKKAAGKKAAAPAAKKAPAAAKKAPWDGAAAATGADKPARKGRTSAVAGLVYKKDKDAPAWASLRAGTKRESLVNAVAASTKADNVIGTQTPDGHTVTAQDVAFALEKGFIVAAA